MIRLCSESDWRRRTEVILVLSGRPRSADSKRSHLPMPLSELPVISRFYQWHLPCPVTSNDGRESLDMRRNHGNCKRSDETR